MLEVVHTIVRKCCILAESRGIPSHAGGFCLS
jgi:hypothetical protein